MQHTSDCDCQHSIEQVEQPLHLSHASHVSIFCQTFYMLEPRHLAGEIALYIWFVVGHLCILDTQNQLSLRRSLWLCG